jgi:protein SCO1/2
MNSISTKIIIITAILFLPIYLFGQITMDDVPELQNIDVEEHLGETIPLDLSFVNDSGDTVQLSTYFQSDKPVLLTLAYYRCPMLCGLVIKGLTDGIRELAYLPGKDFQVVTVSINPEEDFHLAAAKKKNVLETLDKLIDRSGWAFLTGPEENSKELADALGFKYYYIEERGEYAHPAVSYVLTKEGVISRYLYGIAYKETDLRLSLLEASKGEIGSTLDKIILYCYHYDPDAGGYVLFAGNLMRLGGVITVLILGSLLIILWRKEVRFKLNHNSSKI